MARLDLPLLANALGQRCVGIAFPGGFPSVIDTSEHTREHSGIFSPLQTKYRQRLKELKALPAEERARLAKEKDGVTKFLTKGVPLLVSGNPAGAKEEPRQQLLRGPDEEFICRGVHDKTGAVGHITAQGQSYGCMWGTCGLQLGDFARPTCHADGVTS